MNHARAALAGDTRYVFARRVITRAAETGNVTGGEDHIPCLPEAFAAMKERGELLLDWRAHGLDYGIPMTLKDEITAGKIVIVNLSRKVVPVAEDCFHRLAIVEISAPISVLARRLAARGRESEAEIAGRLSREAPLFARRAPIHKIVNDRDLDGVASEFLTLLRGFAG